MKIWNGIVTVGVGFAIFGSGWKISEKYNAIAADLGIRKAVEDGIIKFFNGDKEIGIEEAIDLMKNKYSIK